MVIGVKQEHSFILYQNSSSSTRMVCEHEKSGIFQQKRQWLISWMLYFIKHENWQALLEKPV